jgi:putative ABC transport system ATP-binding protein/lipoprotein-releasing system ATP-binding protein
MSQTSASATRVGVAGTDVILRTEELYRSFRMGQHNVEVLRGITLQIKRGEIIFLCGASGAGKSTLLYTLAGLERPERGRVFFDNTSIYNLPDRTLAKMRNDSMGFIFQSYQLFPELTAVENVAVPSLIGGRKARQRAEDLLREIGLAERMEHLPNELSGGEQQRVAIARALINDPSVIFADEPTGNLDSRNGDIILNLLLDLVRKKDRTLVVVTHDRSLAQRGDRLLEITDGQINA